MGGEGQAGLSEEAGLLDLSEGRGGSHHRSSLAVRRQQPSGDHLRPARGHRAAHGREGVVMEEGGEEGRGSWAEATRDRGRRRADP